VSDDLTVDPSAIYRDYDGSYHAITTPVPTSMAGPRPHQAVTAAVPGFAVRSSARGGPGTFRRGGASARESSSRSLSSDEEPATVYQLHA